MPEIDSAYLPGPQPLHILQRTIKDECPFPAFVTLFLLLSTTSTLSKVDVSLPWDLLER